MADFEMRALERGALLDELRDFERLYAVPSYRLADAFRQEDGSLSETPDFLRWSFLCSILKRRGLPV